MRRMEQGNSCTQGMDGEKHRRKELTKKQPGSLKVSLQLASFS